MSATRDAVVVFARLPVPGQVKTRLAAGVGADPAALFYKHCAEHVIGQLGRCDDPASAPACLQHLCRQPPFSFTRHIE